MNKRERVIAAFQGKEVDHVPVAMWKHVPAEYYNDDDAFAKYQADFVRATDVDFLKMSGDKYFCWPAPILDGIENADDLYKIEPLGADHPHIRGQIDRAKKIVAALNGECVAVQLVFCPLSYLRLQIGYPKMMKLIRENPEAMKYACNVIAEDVKLLSLRYDDVQVHDAVYPELLQPGENYTINGILRSTHNEVHNVMARIVDELGYEQACFPIPVEGRYKDLAASALSYEIDFSHLLPGNYTLELSAEVRNHYIRNGKILEEIQKCILAEAPFAVGYKPVSIPVSAEPKEKASGWQFEDGVWRYYKDGQFRTGWFCSNGVDYYLLEDGAAATGWQEINGKLRFFSDTGAMRTGWLDDHGAIYYLLSNGVPVTGERVIDGVAHTFGTDGICIEPAFLNS